MVLPLAWENELVRYALIAASASHLSFQRPDMKALASWLQYTAIEKLSLTSSDSKIALDLKHVVLATIALLLVTDMMHGGPQFDLIFSMGQSWIEAAKEQGHSPLMTFLRNQFEL